ncbi:MAG: glucosaminidase domain-containing protein [Gammaproteobacteria bacterium]
MKKLLLIIMLAIQSVSFAWADSLTGKQQAFVAFMEPKIAQANAEILQQRERLTKYHRAWQKQQLNDDQKLWVRALALEYKCKGFDVEKESDWQRLFTRVNIVPTSLALAQAINESAWGKSRFAVKGNNYYGQWCYRKGCGIVPKSRAAGSTFEVRSFSSVDASIKSYIRNLNTNPAYSQFRALRASIVAKNKPLNGVALTPGVAKYSQRGAAYSRSLNQIITKYRLSAYDVGAHQV